MKNFVKYILQKLFGYQRYLRIFAKYKIRTLRNDRKEKDFFAFMDAVKGDGMLLDVGANLGVMSYHLSKRFPERKILAIEPMPDNLAVLRAMISNYSLKNVEVVPYAVGEEETVLKMVLPVNGKVKMQGLAHVVHDSIEEWNEGDQFEVKCVRLDDLVKESPVAGIKMDIENFEYFALKGGENLLRAFKPVVYLELWANENRDLCFKFLEPEKFIEIKEMEATYLHEGQIYLERVKESITALLKKEAIQVQGIEARTKNLYRLYKKLEAHDMDIKRIYDLLAIRIIVPTISSCYEALGIIHREYRPMVGRIKDYISLPKPNGYQSLHTTIFGPEGRILEIQIRTEQMNDESEYGIAAHWMYTEKHKSSWRDIFTRKKDTPHPKVATKAKESLSWITQLREWQKDIGRDDSEFMEGLKIEFFKNHIFAFTPKGDIVELPEEATPVDFAYAIHTEVGQRCNGAKADGKMVSLDYHIKNAEVIEIMTSKDLKKPNKDWLRFVKTSHAKQSIRREHRLED